jgi:hypothetical protein
VPRKEKAVVNQWQPVPSMKVFKGSPGTTRVGILKVVGTAKPAPNGLSVLISGGAQCNSPGCGLHILVCMEE